MASTPDCSVAERTVTLLAFEDASQSPLADLMDVTQRQKTASELNAAILSSQCQVRSLTHSSRLLCSQALFLFELSAPGLVPGKALAQAVHTIAQTIMLTMRLFDKGLNSEV